MTDHQDLFVVEYPLVETISSVLDPHKLFSQKYTLLFIQSKANYYTTNVVVSDLSPHHAE